MSSVSLSEGVIAAVSRGYLDAVQAEIKSDMQLKYVDELGNNLLHIAAGAGHADILKYLLSLKGANVYINQQNHIVHLGDTPLHKAVSRKRTEAVKTLIQSGANVSIKNKDNKIPSDLTHSEEILVFFPRQLTQSQEKEEAVEFGEDDGE